MQTMHAAAFVRSGRCLSTAQEVLDGIRDFAAGEGWVRP
jgi:hypothetical protein